jgi:hypothetical protein
MARNSRLAQPPSVRPVRLAHACEGPSIASVAAHSSAVPTALVIAVAASESMPASSARAISV